MHIYTFIIIKSILVKGTDLYNSFSVCLFNNNNMHNNNNTTTTYNNNDLGGFVCQVEGKIINKRRSQQIISWSLTALIISTFNSKAAPDYGKKELNSIAK